MLSYLRLKAGSWVVKAILAMMAIGLAFFFGYSDFRQSGDVPTQVVATVNGDDISNSHYQQALDENAQIYSQIYGGKIPKFLEKNLRQTTINDLIRAKLVSQWASYQAIPVASAEIAEKIRSHPQLQKEGKFDADFYKTKFRPGFKRLVGIDFEKAIDEELRVEKLSAWVIDGLAIPSLPAEAIAHDLETQRYHFKSVVIDPKTLPSAKDSELPDEAQRLAQEVLAQFQDEQALTEFLKPYGISIQDLGERSLADWRQIAPPGPDALSIMTDLLLLDAEHPIAPEAHHAHDKWYVYKWIDRQQRTDDEVSASQPTAFKTLLQNAFIKSLHDDARIEIDPALLE